MPEALAVLLVFFICILVYVIARVQARNPVFREAEVQKAQLSEQRAWLEERLHIARRENWSEEMRQQISEQLAELDRRQTQLPVS